MVVHVIYKISSLGTTDFIKLVAKFHSLSSGQAQSDALLEARGYSPEALAQTKEAIVNAFPGLETMGLMFRVPPSQFNFDCFDYVAILLGNYERGVLPFPGSVSEQPAQIMDIFATLQSLKFEREEIERKKSERNVRNKR